MVICILYADPSPDHGHALEPTSEGIADDFIVTLIKAETRLKNSMISCNCKLKPVA